MFFNQSHFPLSVPMFELFLPRNCIVYVAIFFVVYKYMYMIGFGKTFYHTTFVFIYSSHQITGNARHTFIIFLDPRLREDDV